MYMYASRGCSGCVLMNVGIKHYSFSKDIREIAASILMSGVCSDSEGECCPSLPTNILCESHLSHMIYSHSSQWTFKSMQYKQRFLHIFKLHVDNTFWQCSVGNLTSPLILNLFPIKCVLEGAQDLSENSRLCDLVFSYLKRLFINMKLFSKSIRCSPRNHLIAPDRFNK